MPDPVPVDPASSAEGMPMVKTALSGFEILSALTVAQAQMLLGLSSSDPVAINNLMIQLGMVGSLFITGTTLLKPYCIWPQGQSLSRTTYSLLFAVYGTNFGGSGGNFNVPDLRARSIFGYDGFAPSGRMVAPFDTTVISAAGGNQNITLTPAQIPPHTHGLSNHTHGIGGVVFEAGVSSGGMTNIATTGSGSQRSQTSNVGPPDNNTSGDGSAGGLAGNSHGNVPPGATMAYMIYAGQ